MVGLNLLVTPFIWIPVEQVVKLLAPGDHSVQPYKVGNQLRAELPSVRSALALSTRKRDHREMKRRGRYAAPFCDLLAISF